MSPPVFAIARSFLAGRNYIADRMRGPASEEGNDSDPLPDRVDQETVQGGCLAAVVVESPDAGHLRREVSEPCYLPFLLAEKLRKGE
jgi:hypothetical protein